MAASNLVRLQLSTTTDQTLFYDVSSRRLYVTPLGSMPPPPGSMPPLSSLLPIDAKSILAAGVAGCAPLPSSPAAPISSSKPKPRVRSSPFRRPSRRRVRDLDAGSFKVEIYNNP